MVSDLQYKLIYDIRRCMNSTARPITKWFSLIFIYRNFSTAWANIYGMLPDVAAVIGPSVVGVLSWQSRIPEQMSMGKAFRKCNALKSLSYWDFFSECSSPFTLILRSLKYIKKERRHANRFNVCWVVLINSPKSHLIEIKGFSQHSNLWV